MRRRERVSRAHVVAVTGILPGVEQEPGQRCRMRGDLCPEVLIRTLPGALPAERPPRDRQPVHLGVDGFRQALPVTQGPDGRRGGSRPGGHCVRQELRPPARRQSEPQQEAHRCSHQQSRDPQHRVGRLAPAVEPPSPRGQLARVPIEWGHRGDRVHGAGAGPGELHSGRQGTERAADQRPSADVARRDVPQRMGDGGHSLLRCEGQPERDAELQTPSAPDSVGVDLYGEFRAELDRVEPSYTGRVRHGVQQRVQSRGVGSPQCGQVGVQPPEPGAQLHGEAEQHQPDQWLDDRLPADHDQPQTAGQQSRCHQVHQAGDTMGDHCRRTRPARQGVRCPDW